REWWMAFYHGSEIVVAHDEPPTYFHGERVQIIHVREVTPERSDRGTEVPSAAPSERSMTDAVERALRQFAKDAFEFTCYAASSRENNTPEFVEGLRQTIETLQHDFLRLPARAAERERSEGRGE